MTDDRPYNSVEFAIPVAAAFAVDDGPTVHVDDSGGGFDLDQDQVDAVLTGDCHRCGKSVDHRRDAAVGDDDRLHIDVAMITPLDKPGDAPTCTRDALEMGWGIAPICADCRREEVHRRFAIASEEMRLKGKP